MSIANCEGMTEKKGGKEASPVISHLIATKTRCPNRIKKRCDDSSDMKKEGFWLLRDIAFIARRLQAPSTRINYFLFF